MKQTIKVIVKENNIDIKSFLKKFHVGRGKIEEIRNFHNIFVNDKNVNLDYILKENDILSFTSEEKEIKSCALDIKILFEDDNFIAVYKPYSILVHDDGNGKATLLNAVAHYLKNKNELPIVYPLHRLDFDTEGVVIFAKNFLACAVFSHMIEDHQIEKKYALICHGKLSSKKGTLKLFLGKDRHNANKMVVLKNKGQLAITEYEVITEYKDTTLVIVKILTGRKHQIRVSFAHINHPLVGDKLYGNKKTNEKLKLKAISLCFIDPFTLQKITIKIDEFF